MARHLNLLPVERREHLRRGALLVSSVRIVKTLLMGLGVMSGGAVLIGLSLWGLTFTYASSGSSELEQQVGAYVQLKDIIARQNQVLNQVNRLGSERLVWSDYLGGFLSEVPPGTTINILTADTTSGMVTFSGEALTRNSLVVFEERLSQLEWVASVAAPRQNLLQRSNPEYSFELKLKPMGGVSFNDDAMAL